MDAEQTAPICIVCQIAVLLKHATNLVKSVDFCCDLCFNSIS